MRQFLRDAGEAFLIAAGVVLLEDGSTLIDTAGSSEQLIVGAIALGRAALAAGLRAVLPLVRARQDA